MKIEAKKITLITVAIVISFQGLASLQGQDSTKAVNRGKTSLAWPQFRGPDWQSTAVDAQPLTKWSADRGVIWQAELPGRGSSTPIVVGDRIFLTAYSGYGISAKEPGEVDELVHHVMCLRRQSGETLWERHVRGSTIEQRLNPNLLNHGFASSTCVSDGQSVYAFFGVTGVYAFDLKGRMKWRNDVGFDTDNFGSSASLTLYQDLLIVNASIESQQIIAFDKNTGQAVWKIDDVIRSWSMPVIGKTADGQDELIISSTNVVRGFDPTSGELLWTCSGILDYVVPVPVVQNGIVYCNGGKTNQLMAIRLGGRGDVTETHKLWEARYGANVSSPLVHGGVVYLLSDGGLFQSFDAETGKTIKRNAQAPRNEFMRRRCWQTAIFIFHCPIAASW